MTKVEQAEKFHCSFCGSPPGMPCTVPYMKPARRPHKNRYDQAAATKGWRAAVPPKLKYKAPSP